MHVHHLFLSLHTAIRKGFLFWLNIFETAHTSYSASKYIYINILSNSLPSSFTSLIFNGVGLIKLDVLVADAFGLSINGLGSPGLGRLLPPHFDCNHENDREKIIITA